MDYWEIKKTSCVRFPHPAFMTSSYGSIYRRTVIALRSGNPRRTPTRGHARAHNSTSQLYITHTHLKLGSQTELIFCSPSLLTQSRRRQCRFQPPPPSPHPSPPPPPPRSIGLIGLKKIANKKPEEKTKGREGIECTTRRMRCPCNQAERKNVKTCKLQSSRSILSQFFVYPSFQEKERKKETPLAQISVESCAALVCNTIHYVHNDRISSDNEAEEEEEEEEISNWILMPQKEANGEGE